MRRRSFSPLVRSKFRSEEKPSVLSNKAKFNKKLGDRMAGRAFPTPAEARARVVAMETTNAVGTDAPILKPSSAGNVNDSYVAAALAVMRGFFLKQNGEVNYSSAARYYLDADVHAASGVRIKEWVRKLELLDQAEGQATLAGDVAELSTDEIDVLHDVALDISLAMPPDNSPPASVLPSPPCTATESVPDSTSEKGPDPWKRFSSASSARRRQSSSLSSSTSQRSTAYVPPHLRSVASTNLTSANLRSQEGVHARAQPEDDVISVATSAVSYNSTYHSRMRREQRSVSQREVQAALKHGWRDQIVDHRFGSGIRFNSMSIKALSSSPPRTCRLSSQCGRILCGRRCITVSWRCLMRPTVAIAATRRQQVRRSSRRVKPWPSCAWLQKAASNWAFRMCRHCSLTMAVDASSKPFS